MKANELMIGDWVKYTKKRDQYFQVIENPKTIYIRIENIIEEGVNEECRQGDSEWKEYDEIEPIPLTEEILKANGFARKPLLKSWTIDGELELIEDSMGNTKLEYWFSVSDQYICPIHHVHELQNALRLCGLDELADNFKL